VKKKSIYIIILDFYLFFCRQWLIQKCTNCIFLAEVTVPVAGFDVRDTHGPEAYGCLSVKILFYFDRVNLVGCFCEDCGLISGAGSDFEHRHPFFHAKALGHEGDDVRLRYGRPSPMGSG
jgi:hypothetical protein